MSRTALALSLPTFLGRTRDSRARDERRARQALAQELSDYASAADRNDLELIVQANQLADRGEVAGLLRRQAYQGLFRAA